ncbi:MAG: hypothetical protein AAF702_13815 [Chloroflexota bacterium]
MSLKRWADIRDSIARDQALHEDALKIALAQVDVLNAEIDHLNTTLDVHNIEIKRLQALDSPVAETIREKARGKVREKTTETTAAHREDAIIQRRIQVLAIPNRTTSKDEVNFAKIGRNLAGTYGRTIANDVKWLERQGYWKNGSRWRLTAQGQAWMDEF